LVLGQPDTWRIFDMVNRIEYAAFFNDESFLKYDKLYNSRHISFVKACKYEAKSSFYETTTPKTPLDVSIKLTGVGDSSFTTVSEVSCGGDLKPSIRIKNLHTLVQIGERKKVPLPSWWKEEFQPILKENNVTSLLDVKPQLKPEKTFQHEFSVPRHDTDYSAHTRCASYLRYFMENSSIASHRGVYRNINTSFHDFHIKKVTMLYVSPSCWGDSLVSETWEGEVPLTLHCQIRKKDTPHDVVWYGEMEMFSEVFGLKF
jgi:acyl-CoA thioesterase FadM